MEIPTFQTLLGGWLLLAVGVFIALFFLPAPYGRHRRGGWGPTVNATLGWVVMESPAVLVMACFWFTSPRRGDLVPLLFLALWQLHYLHRTFVFPFRRRSAGEVVPLAVIAMALVFNLVNGTVNGYWLFHLGPARGSEWLLDPRFLTGSALFAVGMAINIHSDSLLFRLRRGRAPRAGREAGAPRADYVIPRGGLFRRVSCPNYLGETIEWAGWALATWSLPGLAFAVWTAANLLPRALAHHRWYRERFPDYPPERKALVPWLL